MKAVINYIHNILAFIISATLSGMDVTAADLLVVDKTALELRVYEQDSLISRFEIACGKYMGNKLSEGDCRTPEGDFTICKIQDSSTWKHDFKDGAGIIDGAYGPYFFRLQGDSLKADAGIGIHGTCIPQSIGSRSTEGCICLRNEDIKELYGYVYVGMHVIILPDTLH